MSAAGSGSSEFRDDVLAGLSRPQKSIPGKYLWDETGSLLFDRICDVGDYYPTGRETVILRRVAETVAGLVGPGASLVEFGSGASHKVRILLDALPHPQRYVAIDISGELLADAAARIALDYPAIEVVPVRADYSRPLSLPTPRAHAAQEGGATLGFFPGTAIGNFTPEGVVAFLSRARATLGPSWFLVGADPNREAASLARAYGNALMASFHGNILDRIVRELGSDLTRDNFRHEARILADPPRVEAHLVAQRPAEYSIDGHGVSFAQGESIHTDVSHKHEPDVFQALATQAGWQPVQCWLDEEGRYSLHLLRG